MGCSLSTQSWAAAKRSRRIERSLRAEDLESGPWEVKLLLLGLPESGKSTILKQMQILHGSGYTSEECKQHRAVVYRSTVQAMATILQAMERLNIGFSNKARAEDARLRVSLATERAGEGLMSTGLSKVIEQLWADSGVQECISRSREYHLSDSAPYYLNQWQRVGEASYVPTQQDILRSSRKTMGVAETRFTLRDCKYTIYDVGGQRPASHRWLECFTEINALVFCVALSDYDLVPADGEECNAMHQSLKLFEHVRKNRWLRGSPVILLLNKKDIFEKKIKENPLTVCFPEYTGTSTYEEAAAYIQAMFEGCWNQQQDAPDVITHFTCATNTEEMQLVFEAMADYIMTATRPYRFGVDPHSGYYAFFT